MKVLVGLNMELKRVLVQNPEMNGLLTESILLWLMVQQKDMSDLKWVGEESDIDLVGCGQNGRKILIEGKYEPATSTKKGRPTDVLWGLLKDAIKLAKDGSAAERYLVLFVEREAEQVNLQRIKAYRQNDRTWDRYFGQKGATMKLDAIKNELPAKHDKKICDLIEDDNRELIILPILETMPSAGPVGMLVWKVEKLQ